ncbi:gas vesicle protein GvpG [Streptomyces sp. NBC_01224]|uniref:gas vesicle protein GvpG n=2 Tax=unclassified Streptomyces TaxID=2593676 RepID=UPI002E0E874B
MYEHQIAGGALDRQVAARVVLLAATSRAAVTRSVWLALARRGLAHATTTVVEQPFVHPAGSVTIRPAPGPRSHAKDGLVHRRPLHRQNIDHQNCRPPRLVRPTAPQGARRPIPIRLGCMAEERRPRDGNTSTTAAWRKRRLPKRGGAIRKRAPRTRRAASCGPACPVATSSPLQALTCRPPESDMGLITGLLTLPNTPVRGVIWVAEKLNDAAERDLHHPGMLSAQLAVLNREFEDGDISTEDFEPGRGRADRPAACCTGRPRTERSKVAHSWMTQPRWPSRPL